MSRVAKLEQERNVMQHALRTMTIAGNVVAGDLFGDVYLKARDGYEGLQSIAETALKIVGAEDEEWVEAKTRMEILLAEGKLYEGWATKDGMRFERIKV